MFKWVFDFIATNEHGQCWNDKISKRQVTVLANTKSEAFDKLHKIYNGHHRDMRWKCEEILLYPHCGKDI